MILPVNLELLSWISFVIAFNLAVVEDAAAATDLIACRT